MKLAGLMTPVRAGVFIACLFIIGMIAYSVYHSRFNFEQRAGLNAENIARLLDQSVSALVARSDLALRLIIDEAEKEIKAGGIRRDDLNNYILKMISLNSELLSIRVVNQEGLVRYGADNTGTILPFESGVNVSDRSYFQQAKYEEQQGLIITPPFFGRLISKWVIQLVRRISLPDGTFGGIAYVSFDIHHFEEMLHIGNISSHSSVALRTLDLLLVARYSPAAPGPTEVGSSLVSDTLRRVVTEHSDGGFYTAQTGIDGKLRNFYYRKLKGYPGYIIIGISIDDLNIEWAYDVIPSLLWEYFLQSSLLLDQEK